MTKPLIVDLPYPSLKNIEKDLVSARIISSAYATRHGELNAILQYVYHHYFFDDEYKEIADTLIGISLAEMKHLEILGSTLLKLGVEPVYSRFPPNRFDFYNASAVATGRNLENLLLEDISGELNAINTYNDILERLQNDKVCSIISRIKLDEELHVQILKKMLCKLSCQ